jgi:hypothetical protein
MATRLFSIKRFHLSEYGECFSRKIKTSYISSQSFLILFLSPRSLRWSRSIGELAVFTRDCYSRIWWIFLLCSATAATNYPSLRDSPNGCQGHPRPCLSPPDRGIDDIKCTKRLKPENRKDPYK